MIKEYHYILQFRHICTCDLIQTEFDTKANPDIDKTGLNTKIELYHALYVFKNIVHI